MATLNLNWQPDAYDDETQIKFGKSWSYMSNLEKADFLKDCLFYIQNEYEKVVSDGISK